MTAEPILAALRRVVAPTGYVVSAYLSAPGVAQPRPVTDAEQRWRPIADRLAANGADAATLDAMWAPIRSAAAARMDVAVFARSGRVLYAQRMPAGTVIDGAVYGAPARIRPLLRWLDTQVPYVVVVTDRTGADISPFRDPGHPLAPVRVDGPDDEIERNAPGGRSQPRYQRRAEDSWAHNAAAVADEVGRQVRSLDARLVIIAGDVRAVQLLGKELAAPQYRDLIIEHLAGGRHPDGSEEHRPEHIAAIVQGYVAQCSAELLSTFADRRGPSGFAVEGADPTLLALAECRVATLLVTGDEADHPRGWFAPPPDALALDPADVAERHQALHAGPLADIAVRAALLSGADVHVMAPGHAQLADGIGAFCWFHD
jgi:hypothetical protein